MASQMKRPPPGRDRDEGVRNPRRERRKSEASANSMGSGNAAVIEPHPRRPDRKPASSKTVPARRTDRAASMVSEKPSQKRRWHDSIRLPTVLTV
jgi:hypothetical protein